jgi:hypothetical protein
MSSTWRVPRQFVAARARSSLLGQRRDTLQVRRCCAPSTRSNPRGAQLDDADGCCARFIVLTTFAALTHLLAR